MCVCVVGGAFAATLSQKSVCQITIAITRKPASTFNGHFVTVGNFRNVKIRTLLKKEGNFENLGS